MRRMTLGACLLVAACGGEGITRSPVPLLAVSTRTVDFGPVPESSMSLRTIDIQNSANGSAPLEITGIFVEPSTVGFSLSQVYEAEDGGDRRSVTAPFSIPAQHTRYLVLRFAPKRQGSFEARLRITSSNAGNRDTSDFLVHLDASAAPPRICTECAQPPARRCLSSGETLVFDPTGFCPDGRCEWATRPVTCDTSCVPETGACEGEPIVYQVHLARTGSCEGRVRSQPAGIDCGTDCRERFPDGTQLTLTATAPAGCSLAKWTGACTGNGACSFAVRGPKVIGADFQLEQVAMTVAITGRSRGTISSDPPGLRCSNGTCTASFSYGQQVTLTATTAEAGVGFQGWGGACTGTAPECRITVRGDVSISARFGPPECGNDLIERGESCDGMRLGGTSCAMLLPDRPDGELRCSPDCRTVDTSGCSRCGDGRQDGDEVCDGADLGGSTCGSAAGLPQGQLRCKSDCSGFEIDGCYRCGDGRLEGPEVCDGTNLGGQTCMSATGRREGVLACASSCLGFDSAACHTCGDGIIESGEVCDGTNLSGQTCATQASGAMGMLTCNATCGGYDTSRCWRCGDGVRGGPEECDASDLGGQSCGSLGFSGGTLYCDTSCGFDTSACASCGDGTCDAARGETVASCPEECAWGLLASDEWTTCGGRADGSLYCWGENQLGSFGVGTSPANAYSPLRLTLTTTTALDYGRYKACAIAGGDVWCWGDNSLGELGIGNRTGPDSCSGRACSPFPVRSLTGVTAIGTGQGQTCAVRTDRTVWCWGSALGDTPARVADISSAVAVGVGYGFACALRSDGAVFCFGRNTRGMLGDGTNSVRAGVISPMGLGGVRSLSVGDESACAVKNDGTAWCWGRGTEGQLGDGSTVDRFAPVQVRLMDVVSISAGTTHACAARRDGSAWCWGRGTEGQLGNNAMTSSPLPVRVQGLAGVTVTAAASPSSRGANEGHSCAIAGGELWCWGFGGNGELGTRLPPRVTTSPVPVRVGP